MSQTPRPSTRWRARDLWVDLKLAGANADLCDVLELLDIIHSFDKKIEAEAYQRGRLEALEEAATIAENWGYHFNEGPHQPWAQSANFNVAAGCKSAAKKIRDLKVQADNQSQKAE